MDPDLDHRLRAAAAQARLAAAIEGPGEIPQTKERPLDERELSLAVRSILNELFARRRGALSRSAAAMLPQERDRLQGQAEAYRLSSEVVREFLGAMAPGYEPADTTEGA